MVLEAWTWTQKTARKPMQNVNHQHPNKQDPLTHSKFSKKNDTLSLSFFWFKLTKRHKVSTAEKSGLQPTNPKTLRFSPKKKRKYADFEVLCGVSPPIPTTNCFRSRSRSLKPKSRNQKLRTFCQLIKVLTILFSAMPSGPGQCHGLLKCFWRGYKKGRWG